MKDKIVEILNRNGIYHEASKLRIANAIDQLYEQERRNAFARGVDWLVHRMHVPQSETR